MKPNLFYFFSVIFIFISFGFAQQFGGDNISYTGDGVTIWDFSRAVPAALACAAVVIMQVRGSLHKSTTRCAVCD